MGFNCILNKQPIISKPVNHPSRGQNLNSKKMIALDYLPLIAMGGILGLLGQSIRVLIGLRKTVQIAAAKESTLSKEIDFRRLLIGLFMGVVIGCLSLLLIQQAPDEPLIGNNIVAIIAIGYAGTDATEGLFNIYPPPKTKRQQNSDSIG